jgi:hypothetical protein
MLRAMEQPLTVAVPPCWNIPPPLPLVASFEPSVPPTIFKVPSVQIPPPWLAQKHALKPKCELLGIATTGPGN